EHYPHLDNSIYDVVKRVMCPIALRQARRPRSDRGKARHSVSSTFTHHNRGSSSHQEDDKEDDGFSRASTPSHTTYINSLGPLDYQPYDIPTSSEQNDNLLFERQIDLLNQTQQMHKELRDTNGMIKVFPPKIAEEVLAREKERKAGTNLLMALQEDHLEKFHKMDDEKEMVKLSNPKDWRAKWYQDSRRRDVGYNGNKARDNGRRPTYQDDSNALVTIDGEDIDWSGHVEEDAQNYAMVAYSSTNSGSDNEVKSSSKTCAESCARLKKLYDEKRDKLGDASVEITAYTLA
nr:hypothetical protein [Tanacetum cinerariifolium]